jgi:hypothetical protein
VRPGDLTSSHLILFGTAKTNSVIAAERTRLPVNLADTYAANFGLVYIYPSSHGHYVVVNSGLPWWLARDTSGWRFLPEAQTPLNSFPDLILFKKDKTILAEGFFNNDWSLPAGIGENLNNSGVVE